MSLKKKFSSILVVQCLFFCVFLVATQGAKKVVKKSRNELKEQLAQDNMTCMEEAVALDRENNGLEIQLLAMGNQLMYQPKESMISCGSTGELQELCQELEVLQEEIKSARMMLANHKKKLQRFLHPVGK